MVALGAVLVAFDEECLTLVTRPSHSLAWLLVDEVLSARLAGSGEGDVLALPFVVGYEGSVLLVGLDDGRSLLAAGNELGLGPLRGVAWALGAADVLAAGALLCGRKGGLAAVAGSTNAHADGLVHTENGLVGVRGNGVPVRGLDVEAIQLPEPLGAFLEHLRPVDLCDSRHCFISSSRLGSLCLGSRRAGRVNTCRRCIYEELGHT